MEREPRQKNLAERIEEEFGANLKEQIRALRENGDARSLEILIQKLEALLIEAGVELTQPKKQTLRDILRQYGREIGLSDEE